MMRNNMTAPPLQGISNLMKMQGRMGDTELVHMSPMEVKGLASLGRLTRNPDTGVPEAFSIGGFFRDYVVPGALAAIHWNKNKNCSSIRKDNFESFAWPCWCTST